MDPIRLEVIRNAFVSVADEMGATLRRAAYSTNIKTRLDYSCAVFTHDAKTISQAFNQPLHLGTLKTFVPDILENFGVDKLSPGDAVLSNDGHRGGIHLNDVCLVAPVFSSGRVMAYVATLAHHVDIGGGTPGSIGLFSEIFQEGLQIPHVRLVKGGQIDDETLRMIGRNVRSPNETEGDFRAQVAGVNVGTKRLEALGDKYGTDYLIEAADAVLDHTERVTRAAIRREIPDGHYHASGAMDDDGVTTDQVGVDVDIQVKDGVVQYDLTECQDQRPSSINTTRAMAYSACAYTTRALLRNSDIPMNDGFYRCTKVITREGTVADAKRPAAIGAGADLGIRVIETALSAFGEKLPFRVPAHSKGTVCNISFGGIDPRTGEYFAFYEAQAGGYGGRYGVDGMDAVQAHMQNTENSPIEEVERSYPLRVLTYALIPDSGGLGQFRGGLGLRRDFTFEGDVTLSVMADRVRIAPQGSQGGGEGRPCNFILNPDSECHLLPSKFSLMMKAGDVMSIQTAGGGGWGPPRERSTEAIEHDLRSGKVTKRTKGYQNLSDAKEDV